MGTSSVRTTKVSSSTDATIKKAVCTGTAEQGGGRESGEGRVTYDGQEVEGEGKRLLTWLSTSSEEKSSPEKATAMITPAAVMM